MKARLNPNPMARTSYLVSPILFSIFINIRYISSKKATTFSPFKATSAHYWLICIYQRIVASFVKSKNLFTFKILQQIEITFSNRLLKFKRVVCCGFFIMKKFQDHKNLQSMIKVVKIHWNC
jgi:hypothetical protein